MHNFSEESQYAAAAAAVDLLPRSHQTICVRDYIGHAMEWGALINHTCEIVCACSTVYAARV